MAAGGGHSANPSVAPPDGGWGWVVVFASFMIHVFTDGVTYSFGVFIKEFHRTFQGSHAATSWIASIMVGVTLCSGPISSALVNKYGCRAVTVGGGFLASLSLFASVFAPNVATLYITAGLMTGLGFGLIYLPAIVSVTCYFEKLRSLATGIAVCGSGLGTFLLAPFIQWLVDEYGWQGAMLIVSALMLHSIVFGILFRPLKASSKEIEENEPSEKAIVLKQLAKVENGGRPHSLHGHESLFLSHGANTRNGGINGDLARMAQSQPVLQNLHKERRGSVKHSGIMSKMGVLYTGSLANVNRVSKSTPWIALETKEEMNQKAAEKDEESLEDDEDETKVVCGFITCSQETADGFREMVDFSLLKDPIFIVYTVSNFLTSIGFNVPYVHLPSLVEGGSLPKGTGSYLIAIIGISNTVGRIVLGYLSDKPWVNRLYIYNWSLTICGFATALCVMCDSFFTFALYAAVFGFTIGAYVGLTSVILVDLLGLDKLTNAFGILLLFQGVASLVGPPITGWLSDVTSSFSPGFIFSGLMMAASGLMLFVVPAMQRHLARKQTSLPS